jgi:N-acetylmuramoyl-L-alanine amidase
LKNTRRFILALTIVTSFAFMKPVKNAPKKTINVVIDAGHGGHDHGMTVDRFTEKEIVASIAEKIKKNNSNKNVVIHLTRTEDNFISLQERAKLINELQPDLVLSLHVNGNKSTEASGIEIYISPQSSKYENSKLIATHNFKSRGVKDANFMLLRETAYPSITVELGFLSNENDRQYLTNDNQQDKIAIAISETIAELK